MFSIVLTIHIVLCVTLIGIVLVQQGKGADAGAIMGGGTDSVLGAGAAGNALTKLTTALAIGFMITSIFLVKAYNSRMYVNADGERDVLQGSVLEPVAKEEVAEEAAAPADNAATDEQATGEESAAATEKTETTEPAVEEKAEAVVEEKVTENSESEQPAVAEAKPEEGK